MNGMDGRGLLPIAVCCDYLPTLLFWMVPSRFDISVATGFSVGRIINRSYIH
jgi:hypothetical protein